MSGSQNPPKHDVLVNSILLIISCTLQNARVHLDRHAISGKITKYLVECKPTSWNWSQIWEFVTSCLHLFQLSSTHWQWHMNNHPSGRRQEIFLLRRYMKWEEIWWINPPNKWVLFNQKIAVFETFFGVGAIVASACFSWLNFTNLLPVGGTFQHFLWTLCFLKVYPTETPLFALCNEADPKTINSEMGVAIHSSHCRSWMSIGEFALYASYSWMLASTL